MEIRKILIATDFSEHAAQAFDRALELAKRFDSQLRVVHAYHLPYMGVGLNVPLPAEYFEELRTQAQKQLEGLVQKAKAEKVDAVYELTADEPAHCIAESAREHGVDLIVMGTRGLTGLRHILLGSVAERTIRHAHCPVMAVPEGSTTRKA